MESNFHFLTLAESKALESRGCRCNDWSRIRISDGFDSTRIRNVRFIGEVTIGNVNCIEDAVIENCTIGNGVTIRRIGNLISGYRIGDEAVIVNVGTLAATPGASFAQGEKLAVLNEMGGIEIPIFSNLSSQIAWLYINCRDNKQLIGRLDEAIEAEAARLARPEIGAGARIFDTLSLRDVSVGDYSLIDGAIALRNGSIGCHSVVRGGITASRFIICNGSTVADGANFKGVFVGEGCIISDQFSAHDSIFFANSTMAHGESAASVLGPFAVSMHKSTLLIAMQASFFNAGSGSNQSNHGYKSGPVHWGTLRRGCKTASDAYLLWPAEIGAFTLVSGRHKSHPDTTRLPFSYLIENHGQSFLAPGAALASVGTLRDTLKWKTRDRRRSDLRQNSSDSFLDIVNPNALNPATVGAILEGGAILCDIEAEAEKSDDGSIYLWHGLCITAKALDRGRELYLNAFNRYMGSTFAAAIKEGLQHPDFRTGNNGPDSETIPDILSRRAAQSPIDPAEQWVDFGGIPVAQSTLRKICDKICAEPSGKRDDDAAQTPDFATLSGIIQSGIKAQQEWTWCAARMKQWCGKNVDQLTGNDIVELLRFYLREETKYRDLVLADALKELRLIHRCKDLPQSVIAESGIIINVNKHFDGIFADTDAIIAAIKDSNE